MARHRPERHWAGDGHLGQAEAGRRLDAARRLLERAGVRMTPQRMAVVEALAAVPDRHFSALELYERARQLHPALGLATVYRTLPLLEKAGVASRLNVGEGEDRFEFGLERGHYHHHLVCLGCGAILEFREDLLDALERRIEEETGFHVVDHSLHFTGYCARCRTEGRTAPGDAPAQQAGTSSGEP